MTLLDSWTTQSSTTAASSGTSTVPRAVAAGRFVAVAVTTNGAVTHNTLSDGRGNTWTRVYQQTFSTTFTTSLWHSKLSTTLQATDVLTLVSSASTNRRTFCAAVFDDVSPGTAVDAVASGTNGITSGTAAAGPSPATTGDALVLMVVGSTSNGILTSTNSPLTMVGAIATTAGSAERSVGLAYKYTTGAAAQSVSGTLANAATWLCGLAAYRTAVVTPPPAGAGALNVYSAGTEAALTASLWDGTQEVDLTVSVWDGATEISLQ